MSDKSNSFVPGAWHVSLLTCFSRISGLLRDVVNGRIFGLSPAFDSLILAFRIPNLFRKLFGEGAFSSAFIPVFAETREIRDAQAQTTFLNAVFAGLVMVLAGIVLVGELTVLVLRTHSDCDSFLLQIVSTLLPYLFFICLTAFFGAILNSLGHFIGPALSPIVLNLSWITGAIIASFLYTCDFHQVHFLSLVILISGMLQSGIQMVLLKRKNIRVRFRIDFNEAGFRSVVRSMMPVMLGMAVFQINVLVDSLFALFMVNESGALSALYYSDRLAQFPLGVIGIAVATAVFPLFSRLAASQEIQELNTTLSESLGLVFFLAVPASVGLIMLRTEILSLLFHFDARALQRTSITLVFYAIGIAAFCSVHLVSRAFFAVRETATPVKISVAMVLLNFILNITFLSLTSLNEGGIALATSIASLVNTITMLVVWRRKRKNQFRGVILSFLRIFFLGVCMGGFIWGVLQSPAAPDILPHSSFMVFLIRLLLGVIAGAGFYGGLSYVLRIREFDFMVSGLRKKTAD